MVHVYRNGKPIEEAAPHQIKSKTFDFSDEDILQIEEHGRGIIGLYHYEIILCNKHYSGIISI